MFKLTEQVIFNKVYKHLIKQNQQSADPASGTCLYRGPNGLRCAIGCLITNKEYTSRMEAGMGGGGNVTALCGSKLMPKRFRKHETFLKGLQTIHDYHPATLWKNKLNAYAMEHNLTVPVVK